MKKATVFTLIAIGLGLFSCKNEVDLTGDYQDTPIVYGLLNPSDTAHYIRIQKAYLVNGNVLETAKIPDSLVYQPEDLEVKVQAIDPTTSQPPPIMNPLHNPIVFQYQPGASTDTGLFAPTGVMIYKSTVQLSDLYEYHLQITNLKFNRQFTAKTILVKEMEFKNPPASNPNYTVNFNPTSGNGYTMRWGGAPGGYIYQPEIIFHWTEVDLQSGTQTPDSLVWRLNPREAQYQLGLEMQYVLEQNSFFRYVGENVPVKEGIKRVIGTLTFRFYVGTEELATYVNVNKPSIGLIQEKPVYTNMEGGALGIFSGRSTFVKAGLPLNEANKDTLIFGQYTEPLNFKKN